MIVGEIFGKTGTQEFNFKAKKEVKRMDFVIIEHEKRWLMARVDKIESHPSGDIICNARIIGYREGGLLKTPKTPINPEAIVYAADAEQIKETLKLDESGIYLGRLDANNEVPAYVGIEGLISKHVAVLASTGAGKSYTVGVILEELLEKNLPVLIIDPHGEYSSLRFPNDNASEKGLMAKFGIRPKHYPVNEYSPDATVNPTATQLTFSEKNITATELSQIFPVKPSPAQMGVLYSAISEAKDDKGDYTLADVINRVHNSESNAKWAVLNMLETVKKVGLFSEMPTKISKLVSRGNATTINLRGVAPELQNVAVYKLLNDIFEMRKKGIIPPLFVVIEEAHNFCPEKEVKSSSKIIRTIASEGRKFGLGLSIISQRPARVDKNVLSQCNTQIILKMTNPNDLKAVAYAEGMTSEIEKEIKSLNPGSCILLGHEMPLFVNIRTRRSRHGGGTVSVTEQPDMDSGILTFCNESKDTVESQHGTVREILYPCWFVTSNGRNYMVDSIKGEIVYYSDGELKQAAMDAEAANKHTNFMPKLRKHEGEMLKSEYNSEQVKKEFENAIGPISKMELAYYLYYIGRKNGTIIDSVTGKVTVQH